MSIQNHLKLDTIKDILTVGRYSDAITDDIAAAAVEDSAYYQVGITTLNKWKNSNYPWQTIAYLIHSNTEGIGEDQLHRILSKEKYASIVFRYAKDLPLEVIEKCFRSQNTKIAIEAARACENKAIPEAIIKEWRESDELAKKIAAIYATIGKEPPVGMPGVFPNAIWPAKILNTETGRDAVYKSFMRYPGPCSVLLEYWYYRTYSKSKAAGPLLIEIAAKKKGNVGLIREGMKNFDYATQKAAAKSFTGKNISLKSIEKLHNSNRFTERMAAMYAAAGREDVPAEWIESNFTAAKDIAAAARFAAAKSGFPPYRTIEPSGVVYKKCVDGIIVVAEIPKDAEIRGCKIERQFRSDKAKIVDVIGDFYGDKIGISTFDRKFKYRVGDEIKIPDFDYSTDAFAAGFHFFLTKEEAESFKW